jgi:hypothetical protein
MHPVSHRDRSMPRDRQAVRAFLVSAGILFGSLSTGCLRPTILRPDANTPAPKGASTASIRPQPADSLNPATSGTLENSSNDRSTPALDPTPAAPPLGAQVAPPALNAQPAPSSTQVPPPLSPVPSQPGAGNSTATSPVDETPATTEQPTPLLDAALERVAAVTREQRESLDSAPPSSEPQETTTKPIAPEHFPTKPFESDHPTTLPSRTPEPTPPTAALVDIGQATSASTPLVINVSDSPAPSASRAVLKDARQRVLAPSEAGTRTVARHENIASNDEPRGTLLAAEPVATAAPANSATEAGEPLGIDKLCICRKIVGFGIFEPLQQPGVRVGKLLLLYCEMTGMTYSPKEASFVSRLASKLELRSVSDGATRWVYEFAPGEDVCASRRRDFFVNYRFVLPNSLPPGAYRLCLTQTDLLADRTTSTEIPLEIIP